MLAYSLHYGNDCLYVMWASSVFPTVASINQRDLLRKSQEILVHENKLLSNEPYDLFRTLVLVKKVPYLALYVLKYNAT